MPSSLKRAPITLYSASTDDLVLRLTLSAHRNRGSSLRPVASPCEAFSAILPVTSQQVLFPVTKSLTIPAYKFVSRAFGAIHVQPWCWYLERHGWPSL